MKSPGVLASNRFRASEVIPSLPGKDFLEQNAKLFYDFSLLSGSGMIANGNAGLEDQSPSGLNATIVSSPAVRNIVVNTINVPTLEAIGTNAVSTGSRGMGLIDEDFEVFIVFQTQDGIPPSNQYLTGVVSSNGTVRFEVFIAGTGKLLIRYRTPEQDSRWDSTSAILPDGVNPVRLLRIKYDFTEDVFGVWLDESPLPGGFVSGSIAALDPADWSQDDRDLYVGNNNLSTSSPYSNPVTTSIIRFAITDILSDEDADDISDYLTTFGASTPTVKPAIQAKDLLVTPGQTSMALSWTGGNGSNKLVVARQGSPVNALPVDGVQYTSNNAFGSGSEIGSGNFVVHAGTTNTVTVTGLTRDTLYYFDVYEFNLAGFRYLTTINTNTTPNGVRSDYINDQSFDNYATDYTEHEKVGFDSSVSNGELTLSGNPKGFEDYVEHNDWKEDLEEFELEMRVRLDDTLTSDTVGIGLGIKNDMDNEPNRGVVGLFVTTDGSDNQGRVQVYSGGGASDPAALAFRTQSSGQLVVEEGKSYTIKFGRNVAGNDAVYTVTVIDEDDPEHPQVTASWTETGRPSSAFYATTTRAFIYQNGGTHAIDYFIARRTGDEGGTVEPPTEPEDYDFYVTANGNDNGTGLIDDPFRTNNRGLIAIQSLGGSGRKLSTGPGVFLETSFLSVPSNLGLWSGAGVGVTTIGGTSALDSFTNRSNMNEFLVSIQGSGSVNVDMTIRNMRFDGHRTFVNDPNSIKGGFAIRNRHGVKLKNILISNFNTCGIRLGDVNEFLCEDFEVRNASGRQGNFTHYQIETWNVGGSTVLGNADGNFKIIFRNGYLNAPLTFDGGGWGIKGGGGNDRYIHNIEWDNVRFNISKESEDPSDGGHHFNIEGLYMRMGNVWIHNCYFNNNLSWGGMADLAHNNGKTRISHNIFDLEPDSPTFCIEMQISNCEIDHNYVLRTRNGCFCSLNDQDTFGNAASAPITRGNHGDWDIHHNIIVCTTASGYGIAGGHNWNINGLRFYNNTIYFTTSAGGAWYGIIVDNDSDSSLTGLDVYNNLFIGQPSSSSRLFDSGGPISGGLSRYNYSTHLNCQQSRSGVTISNTPAPFGSGNPFSLGLGSLPTTYEGAFNGTFFKPGSGSLLKNAGLGGVTVGALEAS